MGKVLLCCSAAGGSGKTTFSVNLGAALSHKGFKVLIADLNMGRRNVDIYLGIEDRILFDLGDVMSGLCRLEKAIIPHDICRGLYVLSSPQYREIEGFGPGHAKALYAKLRAEFDFVIVDCPVSLGSVLRTVSNGADAALMIVDPDFVSIRNTEALAEKLISLGVDRLFYAVNRISEKYASDSSVPSLTFITRTLSLPLIGIVSETADIHRANNSGCPIAVDTDSDMGRRFAQMAERLLGDGFLSDPLTYFQNNLDKEQ
ncbi:MAG: AAA family ATPase [Firmicutes bacterium]|nr:AAA family ATPase [Bacillota bacterium]